jgi:hypothetical protein
MKFKIYVPNYKESLLLQYFLYVGHLFTNLTESCGQNSKTIHSKGVIYFDILCLIWDRIKPRSGGSHGESTYSW